MPLSENKQFWEQAWADGRTRFHRPDPNAGLVKYASTIFDSGDRVLVPLCGKSVDMLWLSERGYGVSGVEVAKLPIDEFISENNLEGSWSDHSYQVKAQRITIYHQDFFNHDGRYEAIYDRACLVALSAPLRARMAERYKALLKPKGKILLITLKHPTSDGPPYSISDEEIDSLFAKDFSIELLEVADVPVDSRTIEIRKLELLCP